MGGEWRRGAPACGEPAVDELLHFVDARLSEAVRPGARGALDVAQHDIEGLGRWLLDQAGATCNPDRSCELPRGTLRALRRIAQLHDDHPDFRREWRDAADHGHLTGPP